MNTKFFYFVYNFQADVKDHTTEAVLHYRGATDEEPISERRQCTAEFPCNVLNCPFDFFPRAAVIHDRSYGYILAENMLAHHPFSILSLSLSFKRIKHHISS